MGGVGIVTDQDEQEVSCMTPKGCRIPVKTECPPAPRKKAGTRAKRAPPEGGYYRPSDLDTLFVNMERMPRDAAWV